MNHSATVSFASNVEVTSHPYTSNERQLRQYRVSEILDHGASDENLCSTKIRVELRAGEFPAQRALTVDPLVLLREE